MEAGILDEKTRESINAEFPTHLTQREGELLTFPISSEKKLLGGSNDTRYMTLEGDGAGVFKPGSVEASNFLFKDKALPERERAAYLVDRYVDWDLVPTTVIRNIQGERGSVQEFIPDARTFWEMRGSEVERAHDQLYRLWLFDQMIWNYDRLPQNALYSTSNEKIYGIDHGYSFADVEGRVNIGEYYGVQAPTRILVTMEQFMEDKERQDDLYEQLSSLLPEREVRATRARVEVIADRLMQDGYLRAPIKFFPNEHE